MECDDFSIVTAFLIDHRVGVEGRSSDELSSTEKNNLLKLAQGKLDIKMTDEMTLLLAKNSRALAFLGENIRAQRPPPTEE